MVPEWRYNNMQKSIIVTGVTGQDGSHMVDYLLANTDHKIYGGVRRLSVKNHINIEHIKDPRFELFDFDLTDPHTITHAVKKIKPDYFINFAAQSFVAGSWSFPWQTFTTDATAILTILETLRQEGEHCRFYNAGSSEEFGDIVTEPQDENHPLRPRSPYAAGKCAARHIVKVYRESYNLYAVQGWLFNHEGVRRGEEFVTRKITKNVARIKHHLDTKLSIEIFEPVMLGNLDAKRDWSDAEDFMHGVWAMLNQDTPNRELQEYVLASGETHTVKEFVEEAFKVADINIYDDKGNIDTKFVDIDFSLFRPAEVTTLTGNPHRAKTELNWSPKTDFKGLVRKMTEYDIQHYDKH